MTNRLSKIGAVTTTKHPFDIDTDDPEQKVLDRLNSVHRNGLFYLNPEYTVFCPRADQLLAFIRRSRRAQVLWNKRMSRILGGPGRRRREMETSDPRTRQCLFSGILVVNGVPIHPLAWPDVDTARSYAIPDGCNS